VIAACAPVKLKPGQRIDRHGYPEWSYRSNAVGIVDPFLKEEVQPGQWFWLLILPRVITSLRHVWSHPQFLDEELPTSKESSESWMRKFCSINSIDYDNLIESSGHALNDGDDFVHLGDNDPEDRSIPKEFWRHFAAITGREIDSSQELPDHFSCSC
jgi:hypothetical protein